MNQLKKNNSLKKIYRIKIQFHLTFIFYLLATNFSILIADKVELKSGKIFENVKTRISRSTVMFDWQEKKLAFEKKLVKRIKLKPAILKPPVTNKEKLEYEAERVRIADSLQTASEWEIDPNAKPIVAIVLFRAGSGVSLAEAESVTTLVQTGLVKTKLFTVIDITAIAKTCSDDSKDCANKIKSKIKVNKIVTGTVTKLGKKFLINGNVIDSKDNSIDFAEKSSADSIVKLEETSEYFSKKIAGGIMEYWDEAVTAKEAERFSNLPYVWKSALVPGWGQWKYGADNKEKFSKYKGYTLGAITLALIGNLSIQESNKIQKRNEYENSFTLFLLMPSGTSLETFGYLNQQNKFQDYDNATDITKISAGALIGFYVINVIDSFFQGKYYSANKSKSTNLFFIPNRAITNGIKEDVYSMGVQYQF